MKVEIDLVEVGGGNTGSVRRCLQRLGVSYRDVGPENLPDGTRPLILPGVGAFGTVMNSLRSNGMDQVIRTLVSKGTPLLGICVGMQVLFDGSEEAPGIPGLSLIPGMVVRFTANKVPQIGWNYIHPLINSWDPGFVYFVNSYYPEPAYKDMSLYRAEYGVSFCAAICTNNITAFQFHPEKSGQFGQSLMRRWIQNVN